MGLSRCNHPHHKLRMICLCFNCVESLSFFSSKYFQQIFSPLKFLITFYVMVLPVLSRTNIYYFEPTQQKHFADSPKFLSFRWLDLFLVLLIILSRIFFFPKDIQILWNIFLFLKIHQDFNHSKFLISGRHVIGASVSQARCRLCRNILEILSFTINNKMITFNWQSLT